MGGELTPAQITEYREAFKLFDTDNDGTISVQVNILVSNYLHGPQERRTIGLCILLSLEAIIQLIVHQREICEANLPKRITQII